MSKLEIKNVLEERAVIWEKAKALHDAAKAETRDLSAEEQTSWDAHMADMKAKEDRVAQLEADLQLEERNARFDEQRKKYAEIVQPAEERSVKAQAATEIREWLQGKRGKSFEVNLAGVVEREVHQNGRWEVRDLTEGTTTAGGFTVPSSFVRSLYEHMVESAAIRQTNVTVLTTTSGEALHIPKTTSFGTAAIVGEGTALAEADPAFGETVLGAWKYGQLIQISNELVTDTAVDLMGFIARDAGRALGNASGAHYLTGSGTNQPLGVFTAAGTGVTGATGGTGVPSADNLIDLFHSVIPPYRRNAFWVMGDATVAYVRKLKDGTALNYLWQPGLQAGEPDRLLGRPVITEVNAPALGTALKSIAFGDFSGYYIRDVGAVRFERSDDFAFSSDLVSYRSIFRTDGDLVDLSGAVKLFRGGTA